MAYNPTHTRHLDDQLGQAFDFLDIARDQMTNGANTIFTIPIANTRTNIIALDGEEEPLGFFCVSAISSLTRIIE